MTRNGFDEARQARRMAGSGFQEVRRDRREAENGSAAARRERWTTKRARRMRKKGFREARRASFLAPSYPRHPKTSSIDTCDTEWYPGRAFS
jgi:hypothetical protein